MARKSEAEEERFIAAFMSVWAFHKSGEPSDLIINAYNKSLDGYSIEEVEAAFSYAIADLKWFPKPAELRQFIESGPGDIEDIALVEADKVVNTIRKHGYLEKKIEVTLKKDMNLGEVVLEPTA